MGLDTLHKRLDRLTSVNASRPLTLAYLLQRFSMEEMGEPVPYDPRITPDLLSAIMGKPQAGVQDRSVISPTKPKSRKKRSVHVE